MYTFFGLEYCVRSNVDSDGPLWFFVLIDNDAGLVTTQSHHVVHFSPCLLLYNSLTNNAHHAESCLLPFPFPSPLPFLPPLPPPSTRPFFPPLPSSSLPSLPFPPPPVPSIPFPSLFVEVGLLIAAKGSGNALAPQGQWRGLNTTVSSPTQYAQIMVFDSSTDASRRPLYWR